MPSVHLLGFVAGNIRSLENALTSLGYTVHWILQPSDLLTAERLILPGVGHFGHCITSLKRSGYDVAVQDYIASGRPFMGICVGLQALCAGSVEAPGIEGLGLIPERLVRFDDTSKSVPHIGWNSAQCPPTSSYADQSLCGLRPGSKYYYVHSYALPYREGILESAGWRVSVATYGSESFVGAVQKGNLFATQFHPEKSGAAGLRILSSFLSANYLSPLPAATQTLTSGLTNRVIACLDVRANDEGDIVVTKGDQYGVRETSSHDKTGVLLEGKVRNLGKPVELARRYYDQGADEVTFLNITSFRNTPVTDLPMLEILRQTSKSVFVPLTIGGGIRDVTDPVTRQRYTALEIAKLYFESGADKVSIGSDAVLAAEEYYANHRQLSGRTAIESISAAYGNQAVVVSVDPKRVYTTLTTSPPHTVIPTSHPGPNGEDYAWYQCTIRGGRESRPLDVVALVKAVEAMGAGEILLNCIDRDGMNNGFDIELTRMVKKAVKIPVIASSGAGRPEHFVQVFRETGCDAALGAGIFHRGEYTVGQVKEGMAEGGLLVRPVEEGG